MILPDHDDDEELVVLVGLANSLLREFQAIDAWLSENRKGKPVSRVAAKLYAKERARQISEKERLVRRYREVKAQIRDRRIAISRAQHEVERDVTEPAGLIHELARVAIACGAYEDPNHAAVVDAAKRWLGVKHIHKREPGS